MMVSKMVDIFIVIFMSCVIILTVGFTICCIYWFVSKVNEKFNNYIGLVKYWQEEARHWETRFRSIWPWQLMTSFVDERVDGDVLVNYEITKEPDERGYRYLLIKVPLKEEKLG